MLQKIVILGTGGTIAGLAEDRSQPSRYHAARLSAADLLASLPNVKVNCELAVEQVAQIDSKDMDEATWRHLLGRTLLQLSDPEVRGVVITHGTDTMEETAFALSVLLPHDKPVVLTGAMRPANALDPDGPRNLADALQVADQLAGGVWVVMAGQVHHASQIRKVHASALDPYLSDGGGPAGQIDQGVLRGTFQARRPAGFWPSAEQALACTSWPRVELITSHAGATSWWLTALSQPGPKEATLRGLVLAGTGNATWPEVWRPALSALKSQGVEIWLSSRCGLAELQSEMREGWPVVPWTPYQARVGLMLNLITSGR